MEVHGYFLGQFYVFGQRHFVSGWLGRIAGVGMVVAFIFTPWVTWFAPHNDATRWGWFLPFCFCSSSSRPDNSDLKEIYAFEAVPTRTKLAFLLRVPLTAPTGVCRIHIYIHTSARYRLCALLLAACLRLDGELYSCSPKLVA